MLLVDTNVVAYALIDGGKTALARALHRVDPDWRAPELLVHELTNVFVQFVRQGGTSLDEARTTLAAGLCLVSFMDRDPPAERVLEIAVRLQLNAYDACYLAAAEALGCKLATEDGHLLRAAPEMARPINAFLP